MKRSGGAKNSPLKKKSKNQQQNTESASNKDPSSFPKRLSLNDKTSGGLTNPDSVEEKCDVCGKTFPKLSNLLQHLGHKASCKEEYGQKYEDLKKQSRDSKLASERVRYQENRQSRLQKQKKYDSKNAKSINEAKKTKRKSGNAKQNEAKYRKNNSSRIKIKNRVQKAKAKLNMTMKDRITNFHLAIKDGPNYVCKSCKRSLFTFSVKHLSNDEIKKLEAKSKGLFLKKVLHDLDLNKAQTLILCWNCHKFIINNKMPRISEANGLVLDEIPPELKLKELEQQTIAKTLLFMKIRRLPKWRMKAIYNRVINVPLNDDDVATTITKLPRTPDDAKIAVVLKRKLEYKTLEGCEYIRPNHLRSALKILKENGNKYYQDIILDENVLETYEKVPDTEFDKDSVKEDDEGQGEGDEQTTLNLREQSTCLTIINPGTDVVINNSKDVDVNSAVKIAPGEGMFLNVLRK